MTNKEKLYKMIDEYSTEYFLSKSEDEVINILDGLQQKVKSRCVESLVRMAVISYLAEDATKEINNLK